MGLDTTHDCWHGAYSAFHQWRKAVAKAVDINIEEMEGFTGGKPWPATEDPLWILLDHSDCDGDIPYEYTKALADRLEQLLPKIKYQKTGHLWHGEATERFIKGLRLAHSRGEAVEFH